MRVIFVGIHNKPGLTPLCSSTKTGKLIDRIIENLHIECVKTNLFNINRLPNNDEVEYLRSEWYWTNLPLPDDIIVLLGKKVQNEFKLHGYSLQNEVKLKESNFIKLAHPASIYGNRKMDNYVEYESLRILEYLE